MKRAVLLYGAAFLIRLVLIAYAEWQDANMVVKYTDIDYVVFTDAARYVTQHQSPYLRSTYRYTPLLAYLLTPNIYLHKSFGKLLFAVTDIVIGVLIQKMLQVLLLQRSSHAQAKQLQQSKQAQRGMPLPSSHFCPQFLRLCSSSYVSSSASRSSVLSSAVFSSFLFFCSLVRFLPSADTERDILFYVAVWLFNPIAFNVSTRGNAESLVSVLVVGFLYCFLTKRLILGSIIFGFSVHFKIYPIISALPLLMYINDTTMGTEKSRKIQSRDQQPSLTSVRWLFNKQRLVFAFVSAGTFFATTAAMYYLYGYEFLDETYLYHAYRKDHRHSFSVYFYYLYLSSAPTATDLMTDSMSILLSRAMGLLAFIPQVIVVILCFSLKYYQDICFCIFLQTFAFVAFNKVCTVQYFVWYFSLLPLVLPFSRITAKKGLALLAAWFVSQGLWLYFAYLLEFEGQNTFFSVWVAGIVFFAVNILILLTFITHHTHLPQTQKERSD